jgi:hypothetical protein
MDIKNEEKKRKEGGRERRIKAHGYMPLPDLHNCQYSNA